MILYVNGDSHSYGDDAGGPNHSYGCHLAHALSASFVCDALPASSNARIIRTTQSYLNNNKPDIIIIGWSTWEREEWLHQGEYYQVTASGTDILPKELHERYKQWIISESKKYREHEYLNHKMIWDFHITLKHLKIPHLFFNTYTYFHHIDRFGLPKHNWNDNYIDPYNKLGSYYWWCVDQGFTSPRPEWYHMGADAHIAWANFLLPYVKNVLEVKI